MKRKGNFGCLPTAIGSMPHTDPVAACREVARYLPEIPAWPQLPARSPLEGMYAQFSEGFPGLQADEGRFVIDRSGAFDAELEKLYQAYISGDLDCCPTGPGHAAGLHAFLAMRDLTPVAVKGQITGPITWGLGVTDREGRPVLYDDTLADAVAKFLRLKAAWQEKQLRTVARHTIIFVDEPSMSYLGSAFVALNPERVTALLNEVFAGISGIRGIHCCSNTDWPVLMASNTDVINFDTYGFAREFSLYPAEVAAFLKLGGAIAWGIVPNNEAALAKETVSSLRDRLDEAMAPFTRKGVAHRDLLDQALLTPSCSLAALSIEGSRQALELLADLSRAMRRKYSL